MKIEVGKFYKTRVGEKRGPIEKSSNPHDNSVWSDSYWTYLEDGRWAGPGNPEMDLVAEWTDEPTTTNPFLKTETRVVESVFIGEGGGRIEMGPFGDYLQIYTNNSFPKKDVAELARILAEISEAMA